MLGQDTINNHAVIVWSVAELLWVEYRQSEPPKAVLSLVVLRCFDRVLASTKDSVLARCANLKDRVDNLEPVFAATMGVRFHNASLLKTPLELAVSLGCRP